jgi:two-component system, NtrC family, response regulator AtoC
MESGLLARITARRPTVGAAVGSGMTAKAAETGGADFLMVLSAGYFRMQGCSSMAALMPYANANALTWDVAVQHVLPRVEKVPVILGVCAQDPHLNMTELFPKIREVGIVGVTNFPSVGFIGGGYRQALEEGGLGYGKEAALLRQAHDAGLITMAFTFEPEEALAMTRAGVDVLCLDLGFAEWRDVGEEEHAQAMDHAIRHVRRVVTTVKKETPRPYVMIFGGPVGSPRDCAELYQHTDVQGYVGGSTIERFPAAPLITQTVREFKAVCEPALHEMRLGALTGRGKAMRDVFETLQRVADTDVPVLILGESGVGKELAARELHRLSRRRSSPLVSWNCGALTETLAMSELFGHEKGAFTGAMGRHLGRFEQAHGGALFMDEVTDLPLSVQASLLRVIQEREIVRVGGSENIPVDVRLIAATNKDLMELIRTGQFRLDLFYRLSTVTVRMPPLRERREDIPFLVREFVQEFGRKYNYPAPRVPRPVLDAFMRHTWPGNIRELRNAVERIVILGRGEQFRREWLDDLFQMARAVQTMSRESANRGGALQDARSRLSAVLRECGGNKAAAARALGVTRKTIYSWLKESPPLQDGESREAVL